MNTTLLSVFFFFLFYPFKIVKILKQVGQGDGTTYRTTSFPVGMVDTHTARLVNNGFRVAHLAQTETTALRQDSGKAAGKLFEREIVGLFTRSTMVTMDAGVFCILNYYYHKQSQ